MSGGGDRCCQVYCPAYKRMLCRLLGTTYVMRNRGLDLRGNAGPSYKIFQAVFAFQKIIE